MKIPCRLFGLRFIPILLTFAVVLPASADTALLRGQFTVSGIQAQGPNEFYAPLVGLFQDHVNRGDALADPLFRLDAQSVRVQTYYFDPTIHSPIGNRYAADPQTSNDTYQGAKVEGIQNRPNHRLDLFPLYAGSAEVQAISSCSTINPSSRASVARTSFVQTKAPDNTIAASTANALQWTDCSNTATVKITGSFVLMLWQWDAVIHANGQDYSLPSGESRSASDSIGSPETTSLVSYDRQRYLYVEDGTLTIPHLTDSNYAVYAGPRAQLDTDQNLSMSGATGQLALQGKSVDLRNSAVQIQGQGTATLSGTGTQRPFSVDLTSAAGTVSVDGGVLATTVSFPHLPGFPAWAWALATLSILVVIYCYPLWYRRQLAENDIFLSHLPKDLSYRQRRAFGYWAMARRAHNANVRAFERTARDGLALRNLEARLWIRLAKRLLPDNPHLMVMHAVLLDAGGNMRAALGITERLQRLMPPGIDRALNGLEAARLCHFLGDPVAERDWVRAASRDAPATVEQELRRPRFAILAKRQQSAWIEHDPSFA